MFPVLAIAGIEIDEARSYNMVRVSSAALIDFRYSVVESSEMGTPGTELLECIIIHVTNPF